MSDTTPDEPKVVPLFPNEDPWVPVTYIKEDQTVLCPPDDVLRAQLEELDHVVLIGVRKETGGLVLCSSLSRLADINFLLDVMKTKITNPELE